MRVVTDADAVDGEAFDDVVAAPAAPAASDCYPMEEVLAQLAAAGDPHHLPAAARPELLCPARTEAARRAHVVSLSKATGVLTSLTKSVAVLVDERLVAVAPPPPRRSRRRARCSRAASRRATVA